MRRETIPLRGPWRTQPEGSARADENLRGVLARIVRLPTRFVRHSTEALRSGQDARMLGHIGLKVPDLAVAKKYYDALMPALGFTEYFNAADEFSYCPSGAKPGTYIFFYPASDPGPYGVSRTGLQHLAFMVPTRQAVRDANEIAMRLGSVVVH